MKISLITTESTSEKKEVIKVEINEDSYWELSILNGELKADGWRNDQYEGWGMVTSSKIKLDTLDTINMYIERIRNNKK